MIRGLYTSALGMTTQMKKMDVITNNIANADTTGYKKDIVITQSFSEELMKRLNDPDFTLFSPTRTVGRMSMGVFVDNIYTDFSNGSLTTTNSSLDVSLTGSGFFAVSVTDKNGEVSEKYTRSGNFSISGGRLVTKDGAPVLGENGSINIPNASITIDEDGNLFAGGEFIDKLKIVTFENNHALEKTADNLFTATNRATQQPFTGKVVQGALERSNVNSVKEMVELITINRSYEANQRMILVHDTTLNRAVNDVGRKQ